MKELNDVFDLKSKKYKRYSREKLLSLFKNTADILDYRKDIGYVDAEYGVSFEDIYTHLHNEFEKKQQKQVQDKENKEEKELLDYLFEKTNNSIFKNKTKFANNELTAYYEVLKNTDDRELIEFGLSKYANEMYALLDNKNITSNDVDFIKSKADLSRAKSLLTKKLIEKGIITL